MIVWLASYPRSGNTFFRIILNKLFGIKTMSIYNDMGDIGSSRPMTKLVGHELLPENFKLEEARKSDQTFYIKTHGTEFRGQDKVIYLLRDGREASLSWMKYKQTYGTPSGLMDIFNGNNFVGTWGEHLMAWAPLASSNTLTLRFENFTTRPEDYIDTVGKFLGIETNGNPPPTFSQLKQINANFFRSGKIDSWREAFTEEQHLIFWLVNCEQMLEHGYDTHIPPCFVNQMPIDVLNRLTTLQREYFSRVLREKPRQHKNVKKQPLLKGIRFSD